MSQSMRDQLLKAGLARKGQVRVIDQKKRQAVRQSKPKLDDAAAQIKESTLKAAEEQRARDKRLNEARAIKRQRKEEATRLRALLESNRLNNPHAPRPYRFQAGTRVKTLYITNEQFNQLQAGQLAVMVFEERVYLVPVEAADRILTIRPGLVCHRLDPNAPQPDQSTGPYANFEVPDDLIW